MSITRQNKYFYCNSSTTSLVDSTNSKVATPEFIYKSQILGCFTVQDKDADPVDLTGATFTLQMAETYNATPLLTVVNASFVLTDWADADITLGKICCRIDMNQAGIGSYIDLETSKTAYISLWATIDAENYLLASSQILIKNLIF